MKKEERKRVSLTAALSKVRDSSSLSPSQRQEMKEKISIQSLYNPSDLSTENSEESDTSSIPFVHRKRSNAFDSKEFTYIEENENPAIVNMATRAKYILSSIKRSTIPQYQYIDPLENPKYRYELEAEKQMIITESQKLKPFYEHLKKYTILVVGDSGVGKTSMLKAYLEAEMNEPNVTTNINIVNGLNSKSPTYCSSGIEYFRKEIKFESGTCQFDYIDTSGQGRLFDLQLNYAQFMNGIVMVADISDEITLDSVIMWCQELESHYPNEFCYSSPVLIIGNKKDLPRELLKRDVRLDVPLPSERYTYMETSVHNPQSIVNAFHTIERIFLMRDGYRMISFSESFRFLRRAHPGCHHMV